MFTRNISRPFFSKHSYPCFLLAVFYRDSSLVLVETFQHRDTQSSRRFFELKKKVHDTKALAQKLYQVFEKTNHEQFRSHLEVLCGVGVVDEVYFTRAWCP